MILQKQMGESTVRSACLARHMEYAKPSICHAVSVLRKGGYITMDSDYFLVFDTNG